MSPSLDTIDHVHVFVSDRAAAEAWYARVLGLVRVPDLAFWAADGGPLTVGNVAGTVHLALFERPRERCRSTIAFGVGATALLAWRAHLGAEFGRAPALVDHGVSWSLYFEDPDGNPWELTTHDHAGVLALTGGRP